MRRTFAVAIIRLAAAILPARLTEWGRAMAVELTAIERPGAALGFALGCLVGALRERLFAHVPDPDLAPEGRPAMHPGSSLLRHPRRLGALCAAGATGLGLAYMAAGGAPLSYLAINAAAFAIGLLAIGILTQAGKLWRVPGGAVGLGLAALLLFTALFGISAEGARRWVSAGGILLQPSLFLVPVIALGFARARDPVSLLAVLIAALALALQPDRAMAGALAAGMAVLVLARPGRVTLVAVGAGLAALAATLLRADPSRAMPFVDQILYSSFAVHPMAGLAVLGGAALMLVPPVIGMLRDPARRDVHAVFGAVWLGVMLAAAAGNYPTPLVGYGGSAILGYLVSLLSLPPRLPLASSTGDSVNAPSGPEGQTPKLRVGLGAIG